MQYINLLNGVEADDIGGVGSRLLPCSIKLAVAMLTAPSEHAVYWDLVECGVEVIIEKDHTRWDTQMYICELNALTRLVSPKRAIPNLGAVSS